MGACAAPRRSLPYVCYARHPSLAVEDFCVTAAATAATMLFSVCTSGAGKGWGGEERAWTWWHACALVQAPTFLPTRPGMFSFGSAPLDLPISNTCAFHVRRCVAKLQFRFCPFLLGHVGPSFPIVGTRRLTNPSTSYSLPPRIHRRCAGKAPRRHAVQARTSLPACDRAHFGHSYQVLQACAPDVRTHRYVGLSFLKVGKTAFCHILFCVSEFYLRCVIRW